MLRRPLLLLLALPFVLVILGLGARKWWRHRGYHPFVAPLTVAPFFADEFDGAPLNPVNHTRLDPLKWQVQSDDQILQRTQWGLAPLLLKEADGTDFVRLALQTFNPKPEKAGRFHLSTQLTSLERWDVTDGLEYEARLRANHLPPGLILGFFAYGDAGVWRKTYQKTEIDFEFLTHQGGRHVWTHIWDNWNPLRDGENDGSLWNIGGANWNEGSWNTFKIRWYPDRTEWICNDYLIRAETRVRPGSPMGVWFNLWAPNPDWGDAYDAALHLARDAAHNQSFFYDVDYVRVRRIPAESSSSALVAESEIAKNKAAGEGVARGESANEVVATGSGSGANGGSEGAADKSVAIGDGEGLRGEYFAAPNLTNRRVVRLDPRVDFDWGLYAPDSQLPRDGFSARWTGFITARFSETYTFSVQSDDGARLWVNGKLLLDNWRIQGPGRRERQIALREGERVSIRLEMFNHAGQARAQLAWSSASTPFQIVPQSQLFVAFRPAPPQFLPDSRALTRPQEIEIKSQTPGATIRYTLDGKAPTRLSKTLPSGAKLRVGYTTLLRADAFLHAQVPSKVARAYYELDDKTPPQVTISLIAAAAPSGPTRAPSQRTPLKSLQFKLPQVESMPVESPPATSSGMAAAQMTPGIPGALARVGGAVSDGGSGVARVDLVITRLADGARWKEGHWTRQEWGIGAKIEAGNWSVSAGLPQPKALTTGRYELKAVAYDVAGNVKAARQVVRVGAVEKQ